MRRSAVVMALIAVASLLAGCGEPEVVAPAIVAAEASAPPEPVRLPIGEVTREDTPALMDAAYPDGIPAGVEELGIFVLGERAGLLTGSDAADACADCAGSLSLFYIARTDMGFLMQRAYADFRTSGRGGKFNRDARVVRLGGVDGGPAYAGFVDTTDVVAADCSASKVTVGIFTEAGPRIALEAPFGKRARDGVVEARVIASAPYQADFAIEYLSGGNDFVAPYLFVNQTLLRSFPVPAWTQAGC